MTIENIARDVGERVLEDLQGRGWHIVSVRGAEGLSSAQGSDRYVLRKGARVLLCQWDNWRAWKIYGREDVVTDIAKRHQLPLTV